MAIGEQPAPSPDPGSTAWETLIDEGIGLALTGHAVTWAWADLALKVAPMSTVGGDRKSEAYDASDSVRQRLQQLIADIESRLPEHLDHEQLLPAWRTLQQYRRGAAALPVHKRSGINLKAASKLFSILDEEERFAALDELRAEGGRITGQRVMDYIAQREREDREDEQEHKEQKKQEEQEDEQDNEQEARPYSEWSLDELNAECRARELPSFGTKSALVKLLEDDDSAHEAEDAYKAGQSKSTDTDSDEEEESDDDEEETNSNEELAKLAAALAKQGRTAQEIAGELLMTVKAIALNGEVAEAIRAVNPDAMSWINYGSVMCATATPPEIIDSIDFNVERVFGPMYDLNTTDRKTLQTIADRINKELKKYGKSKAPR